MNLDSVIRLLRTHPILARKVAKRAAKEKISTKDMLRKMFYEVLSPSFSDPATAAPAKDA